MKAEDTITWEYCKRATEEMISRLEPLNDEAVKSLDSQKGVYIVTYEGNELGYGLFSGDAPKVIYVGISKDNSSRHFISGHTGTSTMRRSLGALLQIRLGLVPVPRSSDPADSDRYNNYAFDEESETKLTVWMKENLKVALLTADKEIITDLQRGLIEYNIPIFNFQNNPNNKYGAEIKVYRKKCAEEALHNDVRQ